MTDKMTAEQAVQICMERLSRDIESAKFRGDSREAEYEYGILHGLRQAMSAPSVPAVDDLARVLIEAWKKAEPDHAVTKHPVSYAATFADMARAVIDMLTASPEPVSDSEGDQK